MELIRIAFNFAMGLIAVLIVLMASTMIAYIMKVTIEEIFNGNPIEKLKRWWDERL